MGDLNPRQLRFVAEYLIDLNATQAAIRAGYSPRTAESQGHELLRNPKVAAAISRAKMARTVRTEITQDRVLEELALLAFSDMSHFTGRVDDKGKLELAEGAPAGARRAVSAVKYRKIVDTDGNVTHEAEIRLWNKPEPLKLAGRHVGLFAERVELTGAGGGPVRTQQVSKEDALAALRAVMPKNQG